MRSIADELELDERLSRPPEYLLEKLSSFPGDTLVLGAGGKMGPSLVRMLVRACQRCGDSRRITAVSRFSTPGLEHSLNQLGVRTLACDLLQDGAVDELPDAPNIIYMTGMKFGTNDRASMTWAMNTYLPTTVCRRYRASRILAFSTGNVYPLVSNTGSWSVENDQLGPVGEYAMSAVGRERMIQYFSEEFSTPAVLIRLNYAVEMRYGVLVDIGQRVKLGQPIDLSVGYANVIWQGDANAMSLASLALADTPAAVLNVAGPELVCVKTVAQRFGSYFGVAPTFVGEAQPTALLNNASRAHEMYGEPLVKLDELIESTADWLTRGQPTLAKPTQFQVRSGQF